jgi:glycosyltransferase involved in cell wall biosynthesis
MKRKNCLLILPRNIFPVVYGYAIHKKNLIEILNRHYRLSIIIISDKQISDEENQFYKNNSASFDVLVISRIIFFLNALLGIFSSFPIQVCYYYFREVQHLINKLLPEQDVVIGSLIRTMRYLEKAPENCRIVFDMIDSVALNYRRSSKSVSSFFWKMIYRIESGRLFKYEKYWISRAYVTTFFNKFECDYWSIYGNTRLMPHGVDNKLFNYDKIDITYSPFVSFIGKMDYQPNIDAVLWYMENVHHKIGDKIPFVVIGAYPTHEIFALAKNNANVVVTGFVADPYLILNSSKLVVAPMQTGAGIQNKVLEAMALAKITILTSLAAKPIIGGIDGKHFVIANTADEFCNKIMDVFTNSNCYDKIGIDARDFIVKNYTWQIYEEQYIHAI